MIKIPGVKTVLVRRGLRSHRTLVPVWSQPTSKFTPTVWYFIVSFNIASPLRGFSKSKFVLSTVSISFLDVVCLGSYVFVETARLTCSVDSCIFFCYFTDPTELHYTVSTFIASAFILSILLTFSLLLKLNTFLWVLRGKLTRKLFLFIAGNQIIFSLNTVYPLMLPWTT